MKIKVGRLSPFGPDDIDNHARLAQETPVVVANGEIAYGGW